MASTIFQQNSGNSYIDGLISGQKWATTSLTYAFPTTASAYGSSYGFKETTSNFAGMTNDLQAAVRTVLDQYGKIAQLSFTETSSPSADLRYARTSATSTAWAYTPQAALEGGDVWVNNNLRQFDTPWKGGYGYLILLHETGHAMGFKEAFEVSGSFGALPANHDSLEFSVMSYASYVGANIKSGYVNGAWDYPQSLMLDDVRALQTLYGANFGQVGKTATYAWSPTTGELSINGVGQGAPGMNRVFMTVWTGGANATYDFSAYTNGLNIDLRPGEWSTTSNDQLAVLDNRGGTGNLARGNIANAYLVTQTGANGTVNNLIANVIGGSGADKLLGNDADNQLTGGKGDDRIDGGAGVDTAVYAGRSTNYGVVRDAAGGWTLTATGDAKADGTDTLLNVEYLQFSDGRLSIEDFAALTRKAAQTAEPTVLPPAAAETASAPVVPAATLLATDTAVIPTAVLPAVVLPKVALDPTVMDTPAAPIITTMDTATAVAQVGSMELLLQLAHTYGWALI